MKESRRYLWLPSVLLVVALLACGQAPTAAPVFTSVPAPPFSPVPTPGPTTFGFGVEYGNLDGGLLGTPRRAPASTYAAFGATWVKFTDLNWGQIVPRAGLKACGGYTWGRLDDWVKEWQAAGFEIQIVLRSRSDWATQPSYRPNLLGGPSGASTPPKPNQWDAYGDFVRCTVERYDGDGVTDMPGLRRPILDYEIESEAGVELFWQGTAEEYLRLLKLAYAQVKAANPRARVIASGIGIPDLFDDGAGAAVWAPRVAEWRGRLAGNPEALAAIDRGLAFLDLIKQHPEAFDVVEAHWLTDYKAIFGGLAWIRQTMSAAGYQKPVWAGDATSALNLMVAPAFFPDRPFKAQELLRLRGVAGIGGILNNPKDPVYAAIERWFRGEQASLAVKKLVTGMAVGLAGVNLCCLQDWPAITGFPYQGLTDENQQPRPVLYSLGLVTHKLAGFSAVEPLALGQDIVAYRFTVAGRPVIVLWYDNGRDYLPDAPEPSAQVELPFAASQARVTRIITEPGQTEPRSEALVVTAGRLRLSVDRKPVFVESGEAPPPPTAPAPVTQPATAADALVAEIARLRELAVAGDEVTLAEALDRSTVSIPAGEFIMGSATGREDERPAHPVYLDAYELDRYEVTNAQYRRFLLATGGRPPRYWTANAYPAGQADTPVVGVSWDDADAYCRWAGKRLPTEAEWEKACRGADGRMYPWGEAWEPARANVDALGWRPNEAAHDATATTVWEAAWRQLTLPPGSVGPALHPVGSHPDGAGPYGILDMVGNASEWVADWYNWSDYSKLPAHNPLVTGPPWNHCLRGTAWCDPAGTPAWTQTLSRCSARNSAHETSDPRVGFRCARSGGIGCVGRGGSAHC